MPQFNVNLTTLQSLVEPGGDTGWLVEADKVKAIVERIGITTHAKAFITDGDLCAPLETYFDPDHRTPDAIPVS